MKTFAWGALSGIGASIIAVAAFFVGRGCHNTPPSPIPSPELNLEALRADLDSLRDALKAGGRPQEVLIRVKFHGDTIYSGLVPGEVWEGHLHFRDSLVDIVVYPSDTGKPTFSYILFPHRYGLIMGQEGRYIWAKAWDMTTGDTLGVDSIEISGPGKSWKCGALLGASYNMGTGRLTPALGLSIRRESWGLTAQVSQDRVGLYLLKEF